MAIKRKLKIADKYLGLCKVASCILSGKKVHVPKECDIISNAAMIQFASLKKTERDVRAT